MAFKASIFGKQKTPGTTGREVGRGVAGVGRMSGVGVACWAELWDGRARTRQMVRLMALVSCKSVINLVIKQFE